MSELEDFIVRRGGLWRCLAACIARVRLARRGVRVRVGVSMTVRAFAIFGALDPAQFLDFVELL
ncbi:MAG: hypothetical protein WBQ63_05965 [Candidatus Acidiferrales bacterium]